MNEFPKTVGWHWYREFPSHSWKPVIISEFERRAGDVILAFPHERGAGGILNVRECWPQQWGGKIEEPKQD